MTTRSPAPHGPAELRADLGADDVRTTGAERFLAVVLAAFLLVGLLWVYAQPLDRTDDGRADVVAGEVHPGPLDADGRYTGPDPDEPGISADARALRLRDRAAQELAAAQEVLARARDREVATREAYRTQLDAGQTGAAELAAYTQAQQDRAAAERLVTTRQRALDRAEPAARAAERRLEALRDDLARDTFLLRLGFVVLVLVLSLLLLDRQRRARSRWLPTGAAAVGASTLLALVMTGDYLDVEELGPIVLSLVGTAATVAAFVAYQRWLARRLPARRVRREECVFCGHPARDGAHCAGCGRPVLAPCTTCAQPRRVGSRYCPACGAGAASVGKTAAPV